MLFNNPEYFIFLAVVLVLYYSLNLRFQNLLLLVAGYVFYSFWDYRFLGLILISTLVDYTAARLIHNAKDPRRRKLYLLISLTVNLGMLGFFKYFNFFVENAGRLLSVLGFHASMPALYVILPVAISFYTFQEMAYTIEVYKGRMQPVENLFDYALYVCYFPQLMAGPIERPQALVPALQSRRVVTTEHVVGGALLILIGLFRKVVIADAIGPHVDQIFASPGTHTTPELVQGIYLFALQIYCDFAGYSDIARGTSRLLGIDLMKNFNQPYFSADISEFWRRWHISLSTWLRDYLYIPLGGNRRGVVRTYANLMITMLLGGLWHGAAWNYVVWGGLHGFYLAGHRLITGNRKLSSGENGSTSWDLKRIAGVLVTFHLVLLAWVFFRAPGLRSALGYLSGILAFRGMDTWLSVLPAILVPWLLTIPLDIAQYASGSHTPQIKWPRLARDLSIATMLFLIILGIGSRAPFIYFQF